MDIYNNRAVPINGTPSVIASAARQSSHQHAFADVIASEAWQSRHQHAFAHVIASEARQSSHLQGLRRFDEESKMANDQLGFQMPNELSGLEKMRKESIK